MFETETRRTPRFRPWERTLPACSAFLTPRTQDACAPGRTHKNPFQNAKDYRVRSTDPCSSAVSFIDIGCGLCGAKQTWRFFASWRCKLLGLYFRKAAATSAVTFS